MRLEGREGAGILELPAASGCPPPACSRLCPRPARSPRCTHRSLIGKAAFHLGEHQQSELAYRKALDVNAAGLPAWKGLAELAGGSGNTAGAVEALGKLVGRGRVEAG